MAAGAASETGLRRRTSSTGSGDGPAGRARPPWSWSRPPDADGHQPSPDPASPPTRRPRPSRRRRHHRAFRWAHRPLRASPSRSHPGASSAWWDRTGPASRPCWPCCPGSCEPNDGTVWLRGQDVTHASVRSRAARGLARTFQQPELFMGLTVREHLVLAYRARVSPRRVWRDMFDVPIALPSVEGRERAGGRTARAPAAHPGGQRPGGRPPPGRRPSRRGRPGPGQRSPGAAAGRAPLRPRHQRLGEPAVGVPARSWPRTSSSSRW